MMRDGGGAMGKVLILLLVVLLGGCGGGASGPPPPSVRSPSVELTGSYVLTGYDRDGIPQPGHVGTMRIGPDQITAHLTPTPPPWVNGTYDYAVFSSINGPYIKATIGGVMVYSVYLAEGNDLTMTTWRMINNVLYETHWIKTGN